MKSFDNKIAVVTGGGTGMGRELVCQLIAAGARVAMCDVSQENMDETRRLAKPEPGRLTDHICDVSVESQVQAFRDEVLATSNRTYQLALQQRWYWWRRFLRSRRSAGVGANLRGVLARGVFRLSSVYGCPGC